MIALSLALFVEIWQNKITLSRLGDKIKKLETDVYAQIAKNQDETFESFLETVTSSDLNETEIKFAGEMENLRQEIAKIDKFQKRQHFRLQMLELGAETQEIFRK